MIHVEQHGPVIAIRMARGLLGKPLYWTTAYWLDGLLIDTGPAHTAHELLRVLQQLHVDQIVVTHAHEDHIGGLAALQARYPQASVYASRRAIPLIEDPLRLQMQLYRRVVWGLPKPVQGVQMLEQIDDTIHTPQYTLRVIETPGHSSDHVSYFEPHLRWVFSGDAFIGGYDRTWTPESDLFGVLGSLETLASLRPERLFPGSGRVRRTPIPEIHDKISYLTRLAQEVAKLEATGLSPAAISERLFRKEPSFAFWTQHHYTTRNLIEACRVYHQLIAPLRDESGSAQDPGNSQSGPAKPSATKSSDFEDSIR